MSEFPITEFVHLSESLDAGEAASSSKRACVPSVAPLITVGMPVFNGANYIEAAIRSVQSQTHSNFELLISDNCSTDATQEICERIACRDRRIRYVRQPINHGAFWNFSFVAQQAHGTFFTWLAHDDRLSPLFLELCAEHLLDNKNVGLVTGDFNIIDHDDKIVSIENLVSLRSSISWGIRRISFFAYPISNAFFCVYGLMRRDLCVEALSEMSRPKHLAQIEIPILSRIAVRGELASLPFILRFYRRHANSLYAVESAELARASRLSRSISRRMHVTRIRIGAIAVLLRSELSFLEKKNTLLAILNKYIFDAENS